MSHGESVEKKEDVKGLSPLRDYSSVILPTSKRSLLLGSERDGQVSGYHESASYLLSLH